MIRRVGAQLSTGLRAVGRRVMPWRAIGLAVFLCSAVLGMNVRFCRVARVRVVRDVVVSRSGCRSTAGSAPRAAQGAQLLLWRQ